MSCGGAEEAVDKRDLAKDTWLFVMDVAAFDCSDRLYPAEGRFGCSERAEALAVPQQPLHRRMIAFDPIVAPFSVDVPDAVKMRVIAVVDLADDAGVGLRLVGTDRNRPMQTDTLNHLVEKGFGRLRISARGEAKIDHLAVGIDGTPEVAPLSADTDIGFIDMPVDACAAQMLLGALGQFWAELLDPAIHRRAINNDVALCQKIDDILVRQRISQIPPDGTENDITRKAMMSER